MSDSVEFGIMLTPFGPHASPPVFEDLAATAEEQGFDVVWTGDHVAFPEEIPDEYPFTPSGKAPPAQGIDRPAYDTFTVLSYLARQVEDVRLGTNVCVVPYRNPVLLTKQAFSVEGLTDGHFEFGVAPGWLRTEFDVLDVPYDERGSRTDEFLDIFTRACEEQEFAFDGPHHSFPKTGFYPTPDEGRPPVWMGGFSGAAFRRTAQYADGWTIYGARPDAVAEGYERLMPAWDDFDRDGTPNVAAGRSAHVGTDTDLDSERPLIGDADNVIGDVEAYVDAGTTHVFIDFFTLDPDERREQIERFGQQVIPSF
jgi:probable F420-dependent oxidoreductase